MYREHKKRSPVSDGKGLSLGRKLYVESKNTSVSNDFITSRHVANVNRASVQGNTVVVKPESVGYTFRCERKVPKAGMMLVGWGGNNGTTVTAAQIANSKHITWRTKSGIQQPNYFGSITQATTIRVGSVENPDAPGHTKDLHVPFKNVLPMVEPNDLVIGGWDINKMNLGDAMRRAEVFDIDLQERLYPHMKKMVPLPAVYYPDFIAANQEDRADNVLLPNGTKQQHLEKLREDIRNFKRDNGLDSVTVLWTANTERFVELRPGLNDTADNMLAAIRNNESEVSQSQVYCVAAILEGCTYINGSPQNTMTPGIIELAQRHGTFLGGDDFKSGQTKMKSVLVDFLVSAGIKPESIVSYNHLGNNDGYNLQAPKTFRSKEISKSNVVDDMVEGNKILYPDPARDHPDHVVVIKYVPFVKDSKRAMDEYTCSIFMNGLQTIVMHNTCEDSLLASPLILDLVILSELMTRITYKTDDMDDFEGFHTVLSVLSYMIKAPLVPPGTPVINALMKQQRMITNLLCCIAGLNPDTDMRLEHFTKMNEGPRARL